MSEIKDEKLQEAAQGSDIGQAEKSTKEARKSIKAPQILSISFPSPAIKALYRLEIAPNQMAFWVMAAASKAIFDNPFRLTALGGELYPEIERLTGLTPEAIDSLLRRTIKRMMKDEALAPLLAYLPGSSKRPPTIGTFLSMWARMVADTAAAEKEVLTSTNAQAQREKRC